MILTLRQGADNILSRGADFSVGCVHGVKQQPVLVASLQHQWLTTQDGDAVPLWSVQTHCYTSEENSAVVIHTLRVTHKKKLNTHLKEGIFEALQDGAQFEVSDRTEPVQQDYVIHKSPPPPMVFRHVRELCLNLIHSDSERS